MSSLVEREPRTEDCVSVQEFLGARSRLMPTTEEGRLAMLNHWVIWRNGPPYMHEEALFGAWIGLVEEQARGGSSSQHYQDLATLFKWTSLRFYPEPMRLDNTKAKRTIRPPLLDPENQGTLLLQARKVLLFCKEEFGDQKAIAILEEDLGILRQAKIFTLSQMGMGQIIASVQREIESKNGDIGDN